MTMPRFDITTIRQNNLGGVRFTLQKAKDYSTQKLVSYEIIMTRNGRAHELLELEARAGHDADALKEQAEKAYASFVRVYSMGLNVEA